MFSDSTEVSKPLKALLFVVLTAAPAFAQATIGSCPVFPADNIWNTPIDKLPVASNSATLINAIGAATHLHPDFNAGGGIPFITVPGSQTKYPVVFGAPSESDPGPYAVPLNAPIESANVAGSDRHVLSIDTGNCILYEMYLAYPQAASWQAGSGAIYNLRSNALRPAGWTSADAAGLPIWAGLVRYDEVAAGEIRHAIRLTVPHTLRAYVWPARHYASTITDNQYPPMGQRFRLKAGYDVTRFPPEVQVILRALKKYGMILADNGTAWFLTGGQDSRWNADNLSTLHQVFGSDLEAVDGTQLMISPDSGQAKAPASPCDINRDGKIDVLDVQLAVNASLGVAPCVADLDGNGRCDLADMQRVINAVISGACQ
jgi:hypothetical protein